MKRTLTAIVACGILAASLHQSKATPTMRLSADGGGTWVVVVDNGPLDSDPTVGNINYNGPIGGWSVSTAAGFGYGGPTVPTMDVSTRNYSFNAESLIVQLSDTNFVAFPNETFVAQFGVITDGTVTYNSYRDGGNVLFGTASTYTGGPVGSSPSPTAALLMTQGPFVSTTATASNAVVVPVGGSPYSLTLETIIVQNSSGVSDTDALLFTLPPPPCNCSVTFNSPTSITNCADDTIPDITASENCNGISNSIPVTITGLVTNGVCPQIITRTAAATDDCGTTNTFVQTVTVNCRPDCTITLSKTNVFVGSNYTASVADAGAGATYSWSILNGTIISGSNTTTITWTAGPDTSSPVSIVVVVTSGAGCSSTCGNSAQVVLPPVACSCENGSVGSISLGSATNGLVVGLVNTKINNSLVTINGNEYVSKGGTLVNMAPSIVNGNVYQYANGQYSGPGKLNGSLITNPTLLNQVDADALAASAAAAALAPTVVLGTVSNPTTITGTGGQNVIKVNGDIKASLILNGTASDTFIVNVTGTLSLGGSSVLGVSGGVGSGNVLYNFIGSSGTISTHVGNIMNGTLLAPKYSFNLDGVFNSRIIGGGASIALLSGAIVNQPVCNCP